MDRLIVLIISFSMISFSSLGFALEESISVPSRSHTVEDHHHADNHGSHHNDKSRQENDGYHHHHHGHQVKVAPSTKGRRAHHHKHEHDTPSHSHSHGSSNSCSSAHSHSLLWMSVSSLVLNELVVGSHKFNSKEDDQPEDPFLASIFRPPISLT